MIKVISGDLFDTDAEMICHLMKDRNSALMIWKVARRKAQGSQCLI